MKMNFLGSLQYEPISAAAAVAAGAAILGTGADLYAKAKMNKKTRQWNEKMYGQQRADALADWNMQNEYNSPSAQMKRFRDAGLNPNLIYGQSNEGGVVRSTDAKAWNPDTPQPGRGISQSMGNYFDVKMREAQINNMQAQNDNIIAQKGLIEAQTQAVYKGMENTDSVMGMRSWDLSSKQGLFPGSLEMQDQKIRHSMKDLDIKTQMHELNLLKRSQDLKIGAQDLVNKRVDEKLKRMDLLLKDGTLTKQAYDRETTKLQWTSEIIKQKLYDAQTNSLNDAVRRRDHAEILKEIDAVMGALRIIK